MIRANLCFRCKFVLNVSYDFDNDELINKDDIITILSAMPVTTRIMSEEERMEIGETGGKYQKEGGGIT